MAGAEAVWRPGWYRAETWARLSDPATQVTRHQATVRNTSAAAEQKVDIGRVIGKHSKHAERLMDDLARAQQLGCCSLQVTTSPHIMYVIASKPVRCPLP